VDILEELNTFIFRTEVSMTISNPTYFSPEDGGTKLLSQTMVFSGMQYHTSTTTI
jgi:hypothetical protein